MPAKSRRNRRNISQSTNLNRIMTNPAATAPVETARTEKTVKTINPSTRVAATQEITYPYILSEIKWISVVTLIVAVILVILYIFLR